MFVVGSGSIIIIDNQLDIYELYWLKIWIDWNLASKRLKLSIYIDT